jgi:hypothetical protein
MLMAPGGSSPNKLGASESESPPSDPHPATTSVDNSTVAIRLR